MSTLTPRESELQPTPDKKSRFSRKQKIIAGGAALLTIAGIGAGVKFGIDAANQAPAPVAEAPVDPTATPSPVEVDPVTPESVIKSLEIPAGLSTEELGQLIIDERYDAWASASADTPEEGEKLVEDWREFVRENGVNALPEFANNIAESNGEVRATALYGPEWRSDSDIVTLVTRRIAINSRFIQLYLATQANGAAYTSEWKATGYRELADTDNDPSTRTIEVDVTTSEQNNPLGNTTGKSITKITLVTVGDREIIISEQTDVIEVS